MLLGPAFSNSGPGPVAGRWEKSLKARVSSVRIANSCATSKTAEETERSLSVFSRFKGPAGRESGRVPGQIPADFWQIYYS